MVALKRHKGVRDALQTVAERPTPSTQAPIDTPVWELVAGVLFQIANSPDAKVRGSMGRANRAQKIITNRLVGRRRAGTHPAQVDGEQLEFVDLTVSGEVES